MHRRLAPLLLLAAGCAATAGGGATSARTDRPGLRSFGFRMRDFRFPSGLRVIAQEDHRRPLVSVVLAVGTGSSEDPPGKEGLAHLVEHLTFLAKPSGTARVWDLMASRGAVLNAFTEQDQTVYFATAASDAQTVSDLLKIEASRLLQPLAGVEKVAFAPELQVVHNEERERGETRFIGKVFAWIYAMSFPPEHPYSRPVGGTHESLDRIGLGDAVVFVRKHYRADNATLAIVGDIDLATFDQVLAAALPKALTGTAEPGAAMPPPRIRVDTSHPKEPPPAPGSPGMVSKRGPVAAPTLFVAWPLPASVGKQGVLNDFLANQVSGAIGEAVASDEDMVNASCDVGANLHASLLFCEAELLEGKHPERSLTKMIDTVHNVWHQESTGFDKLNADAARLASITQLALGAEELQFRAQNLAIHTHWNGDPGFYAASVKELMAASPVEIGKLAERWVTRDNARALYVTPLDARPPSVLAGASGGGTGASSSSGLGSRNTTINAFDKFDPEVARRATARPGISTFLRYTLPNGLRVLIGRTTDLPVVAVGLSIPTGNANDRPWGLASMAMSMSSARDRRLQLRLFRAGGSGGKSASLENARWFYRAPSGSLKEVLDLLGRQLGDLKASASSLAYYKRDGLPFVRKIAARPESIALAELYRALFPGHPLGQRRPEPNDQERLEVSDLDRWLEQRLRPEGATLVITGDIEPTEVQQLVKKYLGDWSHAGTPPPPTALAPAPRPGARVVPRADATQAELLLGCRLPKAGPLEREVYAVASAYAGNVLFEEVRGKLGASYGMHAGTEVHRSGDAAMLVSGNIENAKAAQAMTVIDQFFAKQAAGELDEPALALAHWQRVRMHGLAFATSPGIVFSVLSAVERGEEPEKLDDRGELLSQVTKERVAAVFAACRKSQIAVVTGQERVVQDSLRASNLGSLKEHVEVLPGATTVTPDKPPTPAPAPAPTPPTTPPK